MIDDIINYIDNIIIKIDASNRHKLANKVQIYHNLVSCITLIYIFFAPISFDFYFSLILLFQSFHWIIFKGECIINYIEQKLINTNYKLGDNPGYDGNPYPMISLIFQLAILFCITIIFYRNNNNLTKIIMTIVLIFISYALLWRIFKKYLN